MQERVDFGYEEAVIFRAFGSLDLFFLLCGRMITVYSLIYLDPVPSAACGLVLGDFLQFV